VRVRVRVRVRGRVRVRARVRVRVRVGVRPRWVATCCGVTIRMRPLTMACAWLMLFIAP